MEGEPLSVCVNHTDEGKVEHIKNRKRKLSLVNASSESVQKLKKKKKTKYQDNYEHDALKFLKYKNTSNYVKVIAKPMMLPPTPQIFQINRLKANTCVNSDRFLFDILSGKCFNTEVSERFVQLNINNNEFNKKEEKKRERTEKERHFGNVEKEKVEEKESAKQKSAVPERKNVAEENVEVANHIHTYKVVQGKGLIFHMSHPSKFSFQGEIKVTIIVGEVEMLGYTLGQSSRRKSVDLFSPKFYTPLIVETKASAKHSKPGEDVQSKLKELLSEEDSRTLLSELKANDSLLLVEQITSDLGKILNKYFDKDLFPKDLEDVSSKTESVESLQSIFTFKFSKEEKHFRKNPQWEKIPLGHCTVLCGGKGVGKSTLLRYYVNKLLAVGEKVVVLDFDPGQPEFTFPGCVSAVVVENPVLGPNFTHILDPVVMTYFGELDVSKNPVKYVECVNYVIESCRKIEELFQMKWLVNTMGFCKGLGIDLMITILKLVNPNTVIQIKSSDQKNNYPFYLTSVALNAKLGFASMPVEDVVLSYELRVVGSSAEKEKKMVQGGLKRKNLRDVLSMSYFSKMASPPFYNLNAVQPYIVSFSKLYLGVDFPVRPNDVVKAFNANTVSLSHFEPDGEEILSAVDYFQIVFKPRVGSSLGIGFVRGVDCKEKKFYILTHLESDILARVNCLSLGRVSPPHCLFLRQEGIQGQAAYTTTCTANIIKCVRRMFRVPGTPSAKGNIV